MPASARRSGYVINRADFDNAREIRETFVDRKFDKKVTLEWKWPKHLLDIGQNEAVQYTSDKWKKRGDYQDYKHVAEGPQRLYATPGFVVDFKSNRPIELKSERIELPRRMPTVIAELAPILGIQFQSYKLGLKKLALSDEYYNVLIKRAYVGAAKMPDTGEPFLLVYTRTELCAIITGDILNVEKDGIVG